MAKPDYICFAMNINVGFDSDSDVRHPYKGCHRVLLIEIRGSSLLLSENEQRLSLSLSLSFGVYGQVVIFTSVPGPPFGSPLLSNAQDHLSLPASTTFILTDKSSVSLPLNKIHSWTTSN